MRILFNIFMMTRLTNQESNAVINIGLASLPPSTVAQSWPWGRQVVVKKNTALTFQYFNFYFDDIHRTIFENIESSWFVSVSSSFNTIGS